MDLMNSLINEHCCSMINQLMLSMNCISPPLKSLYGLDDGAILAELIDNFESAYGRARKWSNNYELIKSWLSEQNITLPEGRNVEEILRSDKLAHLALICYALFTVFIRSANFLHKRVPKYSFKVDNSVMVNIIAFIKWQLCEEELMLKQKEIERLSQEKKTLVKCNLEFHQQVVELKNALNCKDHSSDDPHEHLSYLDWDLLSAKSSDGNTSVQQQQQQQQQKHIQLNINQQEKKKLKIQPKTNHGPLQATLHHHENNHQKQKEPHQERKIENEEREESFNKQRQSPFQSVYNARKVRSSQDHNPVDTKKKVIFKQQSLGKY